MQSNKKQQGLSLVELLVALAIGLVLMTGVVQLFLSSRTTFTNQQALSRIQETGRLAIDFMARDIRMAGYSGCSSRVDQDNIINGLDTSHSSYSTHLHDFSVAIEGYTDDSSDSHPLGAAANVKDKTDILVLRTAGSTSMPVVSFNSTSANFDVGGDEAEGCIGDICEGDIVVLSDCVQGRIFQILNLQSTGTESSSEANLVHSQGGGGGNGGGNGANSIAPGNAGSNFGGQEFEPGAEVIRKKTVAYYIAPGAGGEPALWQRTDGQAFELLEGVEDMRFTYGVATGSGGVEYRPASEFSSGAWATADIRSVRIEIVVRSLENNILTDNETFTTFGGESISDRRMRKVFTSTVAVRNRLQ